MGGNNPVYTCTGLSASSRKRGKETLLAFCVVCWGHDGISLNQRRDTQCIRILTLVKSQVSYSYPRNQ
jgi:hypothetical protein